MRCRRVETTLTRWKAVRRRTSPGINDASSSEESISAPRAAPRVVTPSVSLTSKQQYRRTPPSGRPFCLACIGRHRHPPPPPPPSSSMSSRCSLPAILTRRLVRREGAPDDDEDETSDPPARSPPFTPVIREIRFNDSSYRPSANRRPIIIHAHAHAL